MDTVAAEIAAVAAEIAAADTSIRLKLDLTEKEQKVASKNLLLFLFICLN